MGGKCDNKEGDKSSEHPFPQISRYKRERERERVILWRLGGLAYPLKYHQAL